jgi:hypothetical protein
MDTFKIKKNDKNPALSATLQYSNGSPVDLTGGSIWFNMGNLTDYSPFTSGRAYVIGAGSDSGQCEYRWTGTTDTGSVGKYWGEFEVQWTGSKMTLPANHSLIIDVYEDYN